MILCHEPVWPHRLETHMLQSRRYFIWAKVWTVMCRIGKLMNKIANICYFELSEIRTPRFNGHFVQVQNAFPLTALHYNKIQTAHYFINQTAFLVPGLYKIWWIMQMLACLSGKVVHHHWSIGHYNNHWYTQYLSMVSPSHQHIALFPDLFEKLEKRAWYLLFVISRHSGNFRLPLLPWCQVCDHIYHIINCTLQTIGNCIYNNQSFWCVCLPATFRQSNGAQAPK